MLTDIFSVKFTVNSPDHSISNIRFAKRGNQHIDVLLFNFLFMYIGPIP